MKPLDHGAIAARIPHAGAMCLLDAALFWDAERIECVARSHSDPANPLRGPQGLAAVCGVEYCAQAMALHGALLLGEGRAAPRAGYLSSVRELVLHVARLDDIPAPLRVLAERLGGDDNKVLYQFALHEGERLLLAGRAAVVLDAAAIGAGEGGQ